MCVTDEGKTIVTGGSDGRVIEWSVADGSTKSYGGDGHGNQVNGLATVSSNRSVASVGLDDCLRYVNFLKDLTKNPVLVILIKIHIYIDRLCPCLFASAGVCSCLHVCACRCRDPDN